MKLGRNDPCHCGSGKKYKKCCLDRDAGASPGGARPASASKVQAPVVEEPALPQEDNERDWDAEETFAEESALEVGGPDAVPSEEQARVAYERLNRELEKQVTSGEDDCSANELFSRLRPLALRLREPGALKAWLQRLERALPLSYDLGRGWFQEARVAIAVFEGDDAALRAMKRDVVKLAECDVDAFYRVIDLLAWRGHTSLLAEVTQAALSSVREEADLPPEEIEAFEGDTVSYAYLRLVEDSPNLDPRDPRVRKRLPALADIEYAETDSYLEHLLRGRSRPWTMEELDLYVPGVNKETVGRNLMYFSLEFLGYLHRVEGVPYTKGEMARAQLRTYLDQRYWGELSGALDVSEGWEGASRNPVRPAHPLCPDRPSLDEFYEGEGAWQEFPRYYRRAALLEMIPAWLRFLQAKGLLGEEQATKVLLTLRGLHREMLRELRTAPVDPSVLAAIRQQQECLTALSRSRRQDVASLTP